MENKIMRGGVAGILLLQPKECGILEVMQVFMCKHLFVNIFWTEEYIRDSSPYFFS
jgi:hypothetical protein